MWLVVHDRQGRRTMAQPFEEGTLVIGRAKGCHLLLPDNRISRRHVELSRLGNKVSFRDLSSATGCILDGNKMIEGTLAPGQELRIGHTTLTITTDVASLQLVGAGETQKASAGAADWLPFTNFLDTLRRAEEPERVVTRLLEGLVTLFEAQRGFVLLAPSPKAPLVTVAQHHISDDDNLIAVSSTVYKRAMEEGHPILIDNSHKDDRCAGANSLVASEWPLTILCGPLATKGETHGVVYLDRPVHVGPLARDHVHIFETITGLTASLLATSSTRKRLLAAHGKVRALWSIVNDDSPFIVGESLQSLELTETLKAAAAQDVTVLVTGETGTGKEMISRSLHNLSDRCKAPFVAVNCAALPADIIEVELFGAERGAYTGATETRIGRFELASGGTLFLDEVGELPLEVQVKLLRVLEERTITRLGSNEPIPLHFRLVAATNRDLEQAVADGTFRRDHFEAVFL